jgi:hypothetical protein
MNNLKSMSASLYSHNITAGNAGLQILILYDRTFIPGAKYKTPLINSIYGAFYQAFNGNSQ